MASQRAGVTAAFLRRCRQMPSNPAPGIAICDGSGTAVTLSTMLPPGLVR